MNSNTNNSSFCVIPVIDIMGGVVVRAERGDRKLYRPLVSKLCASNEALAVAQALLGLYPFNTLYIADLDAILGLGDNLSTISLLQKQFPQVDFWLDAGVYQPHQLKRIKELGLTCIIGSEGLESLAQYQELKPIENNVVLSLDFGRSGILGDSTLVEHYECWPQRIICMTLAKVGSYEGLDLEQLSALQEKAGNHQIFAAGGTRSIADLHTLASKKLAGALVASALHDGRITQAELAAFQAT